MKELHAKEGYVYTNGDLYAKDVYLSDLDSPKNWKEVPEETVENQNDIEIEGFDHG